MLNQLGVAVVAKKNSLSAKKLLVSSVMLMMIASLAACGSKDEKKAGQALARVNGDEITVLQLNEELQRAGVPAAQQEAASKQLLESLIDRQLVVSEASKEKIERDPKVVQAIERAKSLIIAQFYMQKHIGNVVKPTADEVAKYFDQHPEYFAQRKLLEMRQLVIDTASMNDELKAAMDGAKGLEEVAAWLESHKVQYARAQASRSTSDLPSELSSKLLNMPKGQLFIVKEGNRTSLISIADVKDAPVTLAAATPQIEQFLVNKRNKDIADAEIKRLRTAAKIEYLGKAASASASASAVPAAVVNSAAEVGDTNARGVAGLK